jgi:hypothetical protein
MITPIPASRQAMMTRADKPRKWLTIDFGP